MTLPTLLAIFLVMILWLVLRSKSGSKPNDKLARFWRTSKYPTKVDIQKKYPKSVTLQQKSVERKIREEREKEKVETERKKQIIDRHIQAARKEVEAKSNPSSFLNNNQNLDNKLSSAELSTGQKIKNGTVK